MGKLQTESARRTTTSIIHLKILKTRISHVHSKYSHELKINSYSWKKNEWEELKLHERSAEMSAIDFFSAVLFLTFRPQQWIVSYLEFFCLQRSREEFFKHTKRNFAQPERYFCVYTYISFYELDFNIWLTCQTDIQIYRPVRLESVEYNHITVITTSENRAERELLE